MGRCACQNQKDFWKTDYNDSQWQSPEYPSGSMGNSMGMELLFMSISDTSSTISWPNPPHVPPQNYNPVGSLPQRLGRQKLDGKDIYIQFGAVRSVCIYG